MKKHAKWIVLACGLAFVGVLVAGAWEYAVRSRLFYFGPGCAGNLRSIVMAAHLYHDDYGSLPPAYLQDENGRPTHSWRVLLLPYMEEEDLYHTYRFDEPWNGPNNRKLADHGLRFQCPFHETNDNSTNYLAVLGHHTAWRGSETMTFDMIQDPFPQTIVVVEVRNSGIHWMEPRDLHVVQMAPGINPEAGQGISSNHHGGANVAFADASARFLRNDTPLEKLEAMLTINGGETLSE